MASSSPVNVGDILGGKYQVERVLGVGGMGVVVSARHLTLGERVAIKFLLPEALAREDVVKRFIQEGRASNRLRGEHIARVHDVGRLATGAPFLVMEYLDGSDLGAVLRDHGPLSVETAVEYLLQACEALAEAHGANIIHRDLKPSNLFLIKRLDGSPSIKLIDFGISKIQVPGADGAEGEMTATAVMMGSPLYMAPEQMASARDVDLRADIWSLGILLHAMLTGSPPFRASSVMQVYELIVQGAPPIRTQRADVPEGVEAAILRCLQKDRRQRYDSVGELADAIAAFGPPEARFTADRIKRIIAAQSGRDTVAPPSSEVPVPVVAITPAANPITEAFGEATALLPAPVTAPPTHPTPPAQPAERTRPSPSGPVSSTSAASDPPGTDGPWDQRTHPPSSRARPAALIVAMAAVLVGAPLGFLALRSSEGPTLTPSVDSAGAHQAVASTSSAPADPGLPSALPAASVAPLTSTPTRSSPVPPSAAPRPTAEAPATARGHRPPPPPPPHLPAHVKSPDDLFDTQK